MLKRALFVMFLTACVDPDLVAPYPGTLSPEMETLLVKASQRQLSDPEIDTLLAKHLLAAKLAEHEKVLGRALSEEERARVEAALISRAPQAKLALAARAAGYTHHPEVAARIVTALENDELERTPPSKEALHAAYVEQLNRFDATRYHDRASLSSKLHPELVWVRVWETKNKALAGALPKLPSKPTARDVGPLAKQATTLPRDVVDAAFAIDKPEGFSGPIAVADRFYVVQRVAKVPATAVLEVTELLRKIVDERRRPAIRRALLGADK
jgi:hypothetical protein